ncbi:N-lysine methyltransferase KMT5A-like [Eublepharis macularius]|uniref:N-lysine methyltransferase KMT5A-like n=1 Tax=Eublepharis macularius TaxID=481883 RepID=A0AA97L3T0_EUBMA|nr:N-lysine methyltransferase KMT5A-like [Eublepharis macularius]
METSEEERLDEMLAACSQFEQFLFFTLQRMLHEAKEKEEKLLRHEESLRNYEKEAEERRSEIKVFKEQAHDVKSRIDEIQRRIKDELQNEQQAVKEANETIERLRKTTKELQREVKEAKEYAEFWERKCSEQRPSIISEKGHPKEGEGEGEAMPSATEAADLQEDLLKIHHEKALLWKESRPSWICPSSEMATPGAPPVKKPFLEESVFVQASAAEGELFSEAFREQLTSTLLRTTEEPSSKSEPSTSREGAEPSHIKLSERKMKAIPPPESSQWADCQKWKQNVAVAMCNAEEQELFEVCSSEENSRGVVAKKPFQKGDFLLEYCGEVIDLREAKLREQVYSCSERKHCYMYYFKFNDKTHCIDAMKEDAKLGRLVNHSKTQVNAVTTLVVLDGKPHLILTAKRDIQPGEEILFDYEERARSAIEAKTPD